MRQDDTYFYDYVNRMVVELDRVYRVIDEAKVEEKSFKKGKGQWRKSGKDDRLLKKSFNRNESVFSRADLPAGAETKKKAKCPSTSFICWRCGAVHHLRECKEFNDEEKANIIEHRRRHKPRVVSVLAGELIPEALMERKVKYSYTLDSEAFTTMVL